MVFPLRFGANLYVNLDNFDPQTLKAASLLSIDMLWQGVQQQNDDLWSGKPPRYNEEQTRLVQLQEQFADRFAQYGTDEDNVFVGKKFDTGQVLAEGVTVYSGGDPASFVRRDVENNEPWHRVLERSLDELIYRTLGTEQGTEEPESSLAYSDVVVRHRRTDDGLVADIAYRDEITTVKPKFPYDVIKVGLYEANRLIKHHTGKRPNEPRISAKHKKQQRENAHVLGGEILPALNACLERITQAGKMNVLRDGWAKIFSRRHAAMDD